VLLNRFYVGQPLTYIGSLSLSRIANLQHIAYTLPRSSSSRYLCPLELNPPPRQLHRKVDQNQTICSWLPIRPSGWLFCQDDCASVHGTTPHRKSGPAYHTLSNSSTL